MKHDLPPQSDEEIVRRILQGAVDAFGSLLERHGDTVLGIVKRHVPPKDAEETVQEVFVRAYRSLPTFRERGHFRQWISSIAVRTCCDYWRKAYRSQEVAVSLLGERHRNWLEEVVSENSQEALREEDSQKEAAELLDWALGRVSAEDRMVLEMVYLEGLSVREAARLLGWSAAKVKVRSFRARRRLEGLLRGLMPRGRKAT